MAAQSAGILLFRRTAGVVQFLLAHPGGPFWSKKDEGSWSIPKGLYQDHETAIDAARRELQEEIGLTITGDLVELGKFKQPSGKVISAWAAERTSMSPRCEATPFRWSGRRSRGGRWRIAYLSRDLRGREAATAGLRGPRPKAESLRREILGLEAKTAIFVASSSSISKQGLIPIVGMRSLRRRVGRGWQPGDQHVSPGLVLVVGIGRVHRVE